MRTGHDYTELCKNIPDKFRESLSKCSADHLKISVWRNISASDSQNLAGIFFLYVLCRTEREDSEVFRQEENEEIESFFVIFRARVSNGFKKASTQVFRKI